MLTWVTNHWLNPWYHEARLDTVALIAIYRRGLRLKRTTFPHTVGSETSACTPISNVTKGSTSPLPSLSSHFCDCVFQICSRDIWTYLHMRTIGKHWNRGASPTAGERTVMAQRQEGWRDSTPEFKPCVCSLTSEEAFPCVFSLRSKKQCCQLIDSLQQAEHTQICVNQTPSRYMNTVSLGSTGPLCEQSVNDVFLFFPFLFRSRE